MRIYYRMDTTVGTSTSTAGNVPRHSQNHDLKRHMRLLSRHAWKCASCDKVFSRRDTVMRHKKRSRLRGTSKGGKGGSEACVGAEIVEVQVDYPDDETCHARLWSGITDRMPPNTQGLAQMNPEGTERENQLKVLRAMQLVVLVLHPLLQICISHSSGTASGPVTTRLGACHPC